MAVIGSIRGLPDAQLQIVAIAHIPAVWIDIVNTLHRASEPKRVGHLQYGRDNAKIVVDASLILLNLGQIIWYRRLHGFTGPRE